MLQVWGLLMITLTLRTKSSTNKGNAQISFIKRFVHFI